MKKLAVFISLIIFLASLPTITNAQIDVKGKIKNKARNRADNHVDRGIDKGFDAVETGVKEGVKKKEKPEETSKDENMEQKQQDSGSGKVEKGTEKSQKSQPGIESYSKFDFIPGEKVIFYEDFSQDAVGDFPALWNTNGSGEVVTNNLFPGNWLRVFGSGAIWTEELLNLPENYTIEFDVIPIKGEEGTMAGYNFRLIQSVNAKAYDHGAVPGKAGFFFNLEYYGRPTYRTYVNGEEGSELELTGNIDDEKYYQEEDQKYHISIWVQKSRIRLYQNENKIIDLPKAFPLKTIKMDRIRFEEGAGLFSNVRIAIGAPDMRNKLMTEGKLVTYGIYFDVNKDVVKPESYGTLKEIAKILNEVPDVKVKIVGHTDADGADASNLDLSKRRAASVKAELAKSFGVNADRLVSDGMGESQPVAPNDTPANKALNRRVEFIKL